MYEFERSVLSKDQLAQKSGKDMGDDVMGASGGDGRLLRDFFFLRISRCLVVDPQAINFFSRSRTVAI